MTILAEQAEQASKGDHQQELNHHMLAHLMCQQRRTITGLLRALGRQDIDWSKAYRLYQDHIDTRAIFGPLLDGVLELLAPGAALVVGLDDSYLKKSGKKVASAGWYRDPLGPPFHTNLMWAQRFIQISAAIPDPANPKRSRMIPVAVQMIAKIPKPGKKASPEDLARYEELKALNRPGVHAAKLLQQLRTHLDAAGHQNAIIQVCGDGDYSNSTLIPQLPARTHYIGRTRSDLHLCACAGKAAKRTVGRPGSYGPQLPTPEQVRKDPAVPWKTLRVCNGPKTTRVRYKRIKRVKWAVAGEKAVIQVIVIAPLRYKTRKGGPWKYTDPTYLVCTDATLKAGTLVQAYFWRWGIEVNFKEQKQLFGAGQAQVRHPSGVSAAPAVCIATYGALLLAGIRAYGFHGRPPSVRPPKWYMRKLNARVTASDLLQQLQHELMLNAKDNLSPLAPGNTPTPSDHKSEIPRAA